MKKNKYIIFAAIGFELIGLILIAVYIGNELAIRKYPDYIAAILIICAFITWFIRLIFKLKKIKND